MEVVRKKLKRKGDFSDQDIVNHIARLHYEGLFSNNAGLIFRDSSKKHKLRFCPNIPWRKRKKGVVKDRWFFEVSSVSGSEEEEEGTQAVNSANILKEHDDNKGVLPTKNFLHAVKNALMKSNNPEEDLKLIDQFDLMIERIERPQKYVGVKVLDCNKTGEGLHRQCQNILASEARCKLQFENAKKRLKVLMINDTIEKEENDERKKIIQLYLDKLITKHEISDSITERMIQQNTFDITIRKTRSQKRLEKLSFEEEILPAKKAKTIVKKEPIGRNSAKKLPANSNGKNLNKKPKGKYKLSQLLKKMKTESNINNSSSSDEEVIRSNVDNHVEIISDPPVNDDLSMPSMAWPINHAEDNIQSNMKEREPESNEDIQLKTFTLLLQAFHVDTKNIIQSLPQSGQAAAITLPEHSVGQDENDRFPECFPLSPNATTLSAFRTLLLHRRHLFSIVNKKYPPILNSIPAVRDVRYRESRTHQALTKRFKSTFFWPSFLATFLPKYVPENEKKR